MTYYIVFFRGTSVFYDLLKAYVTSEITAKFAIFPVRISATKITLSSFFKALIKIKFLQNFFIIYFNFN